MEVRPSKDDGYASLDFRGAFYRPFRKGVVLALAAVFVLVTVVFFAKLFTSDAAIGWKVAAPLILLPWFYFDIYRHAVAEIRTQVRAEESKLVAINLDKRYDIRWSEIEEFVIESGSKFAGIRLSDGEVLLLDAIPAPEFSLDITREHVGQLNQILAAHRDQDEAPAHG